MNLTPLLLLLLLLPSVCVPEDDQLALFVLFSRQLVLSIRFIIGDELLFFEIISCIKKHRSEVIMRNCQAHT